MDAEPTSPQQSYAPPPPQQPPPVLPPNQSTKTRSQIFTLLILLVLAGIPLGVYSFNNRPSQSQKTNTPITPTPSINNAIQASPADNFQPAIHPDVLNIFKKMPAIKNSQMLITTIDTVSVVDLVLEGKRSKDKFYPLVIKIQEELLFKNDKVEKKDRWLYMTQKNIDKLKIIIVENSQERPARLKDIKIGDRIEITETYNPFYAPTDTKHTVSGSFKIIR